MVTVTFYNLIRSQHNVKELTVPSGSVRSVLSAIQKQHPAITTEELEQAVMFINQKKVMHLKRFDETVNDGDKIVFTNFVGGG